MKFHEKYTNKTEKELKPTENSQKLTLSDDFYALCEQLAELNLKLRLLIK